MLEVLKLLVEIALKVVPGTTEARSALARQKQNLIVIADILDEHSDQLQIIDATTYRRLRLLLNRKSGILAQLNRLIGPSCLPLIKNYYELLKLTGAPGNPSLQSEYDAVRHTLEESLKETFTIQDILQAANRRKGSFGL
jgi:hypothetical protein